MQQTIFFKFIYTLADVYGFKILHSSVLVAGLPTPDDVKCQTISLIPVVKLGLTNSCAKMDGYFLIKAGCDSS